MFKVKVDYEGTYDISSAAEVIETLKEFYPEAWATLTKCETNHAEDNLLCLLPWFTADEPYFFEDLTIWSVA